MTGPKLNERSFAAGQRSGTRATARYVRTSAFKARAVLDLIRDLDVRSADEVLQFTDRHVARDVRKVLASAVANAVANDGQDAEELYVVACFADEGPTLRRFRPRARGRATRINKRTCHITVIVARMSDERIDLVRAREERAGSGRGRPQSSAASRRARVERSRRRAAEREAADVTETVDETPVEADTADEAPADESAVEAAVDVPAGLEPGSYPGSVLPTDDGEAPEGYPIKGNEGSMLYHEPGSRYYRATKAEVWFDSVESAQAAGFTAPGGTASDEADGPTTAEGSASDEADAARGGSGADDEPAIETGEPQSDDGPTTAEGSASDEADAARGGSGADDEPAIDTENQRADEEDR